MRKLAVLVSYIFHPVFMHFYAVLVVLFFHPYTSAKYILEGKLMYAALTSINVVFLPIALIYLLRYRGILSSVQMEKREERKIVYPILLVLFGISVFQMINNEFPEILSYFFLAVCAGILVLWLINFAFKISMHTASIGAVVALFSYILIMDNWQGAFYWVVFFLLLGGIIGTARLYLKAHKPIEIYTGFLVGLITTISTLWIITLV